MLLRRKNVWTKLLVVLTVAALALVALAGVGALSMNSLTVKGHAYNNVIEARDLTAEVQGPRQFVVESYLTVLELVTVAAPADHPGLERNLGKLEHDYFARHAFWSSALGATDAEVRDALLVRSYQPAAQFFAIVDTQFLPAVNGGQGQVANTLAKGILHDLYIQHEKAIGDVVLLASARQQQAQHDVADSIRRQTMLLLGLAVLLVAIVIGVCVAVARSISRRLRLLTRAATHAAETDLPRLVASVRDATDDAEVPTTEPLVVHNGDDLADLAAAFNSVHRTAVAVAVDQARSRRNIANMFVNLGRRNQVLLKRTLAFISELEQNERDPATLENLFRIDHLATRMRRNAESLLVLAGGEPARTWLEPLDIGDVMRAAVSEIEEYTRVRLVLLHPTALRGNAAADVTHLLAELLENATTFSPPSTQVKVTGKPQPDGSYVISVVDKGIGMTADELAESNRRIREVAALDQRPQMVQGLYVVGRLAARHGVAVRFASSSDGGVLVEVQLPAGLLEEPPPEIDTLSSVASGATVGSAADRFEPQLALAMAVQPAFAATDTVAVELTESGLVRRIRGTQLFDTGPAPDEPTDGPATPAESVRASLSRFQQGVDEGRNQAVDDGSDGQSEEVR